MRIAIIAAAVLVQSTAALDAQPLTCSTWQQITTCQGPGGYRSTEWDSDGMTIGQDNRDIETTTVEQPRAR